MYEKILVPLDGSTMGEAALPHVKSLVAKLTPSGKVEVTLCQVVSPLLTTMVVAGEAPARIALTEAELKQIQNVAMKYLKKTGEFFQDTGASVKYKVLVGRTAEEIINTADSIKADLVAMSTHGRSGFSQWAFGSVTAKVLKGGHTPILLIRARKDSEKE
jgi:nucleotide-binding universal stress UspA family protein